MWLGSAGFCSCSAVYHPMTLGTFWASVSILRTEKWETIIPT